MSDISGGFPPRLYLIGAQKAGTTSLAYLLGQHPDIVLSDPKEPGFFAANYDKGLAWYRRCFAAERAPVMLDASTGYTMASVGQGAGDDTVPKRIWACAPDARFIYVLRDPVERTISAYRHDRRAGRLHGGLRDAVASHPFYADVSRYRRQIEPFLAHFPLDRFLFVDFRELSDDPVGVARRCIAFAGLDPDAAALDLGAPKNAAFQFNGIGRMFFTLFPDERAASRFVGFVKGMTPPAVHRLAKGAMTRAPDRIDEAERRWLAGLFEAENRAMESLAGFRFYR